MEHAAKDIPCLSVSGFRAELGFTLAELGEKIGLSKSQMHEVERTERASLRVALRLEELSSGRIDASNLSDDVRLSRHALTVTAESAEASTGQINGLSGGSA